MRRRRSLEARAEEALARAREATPGDVSVGRGVADGLVVGSRGFGSVRRMLVGSVAAELTRDVPCGLMVVPRGAAVRVVSSEPPSEALGVR